MKILLSKQHRYSKAALQALLVPSAKQREREERTKCETIRVK